MALVIQKFGGTSLASVSLIKKAATHVVEAKNQGHDVICVASAMANTTDELAALAHEFHANQTPEHDVLLAAGEQTAAALFAMALQTAGLKSRSWLAWQMPLHTDNHHGHATIQNINLEGMQNFLQENGVSVVAGFQGLTQSKRLTTLGRGGSDTTALALASLFAKHDACVERAIECTIFTDVAGVYTADPNLVPDAQHLQRVDYQTMHAMAEAGAKILHPQSIAYAHQHHIPVVLRKTHPTNLTEQQRCTHIKKDTGAPQPAFLFSHTTGWHAYAISTHTPIARQLVAEIIAKHPLSAYSINPNQLMLHKVLSDKKCSILQESHIVRASQASLAAITLQGSAFHKKNAAHKYLCDFLKETKDPCVRMAEKWVAFVPEHRLAATLQNMHYFLCQKNGHHVEFA